MKFVDTLYCSSKFEIKKIGKCQQREFSIPALLDVADSLGAHPFPSIFL